MEVLPVTLLKLDDPVDHNNSATARHYVVAEALRYTVIDLSMDTSNSKKNTPS
jgi:hypothetical protein